MGVDHNGIWALREAAWRDPAERLDASSRGPRPAAAAVALQQVSHQSDLAALEEAAGASAAPLAGACSSAERPDWAVSRLA